MAVNRQTDNKLTLLKWETLNIHRLINLYNNLYFISHIEEEPSPTKSYKIVMLKTLPTINIIKN